MRGWIGVAAFVAAMALAPRAWAAFERVPCDAESGGLADVCAAAVPLYGRSFGNPAHLVWASCIPFRATACRLYGLEGLGWNSVSGGRQWGSAAVSLGAAQFGMPGYRELTLAVSVGLGFEPLAYGVRVRSLLLDIENLGSRACAVVDVGVLARACEMVRVGFLVSGLAPPHEDPGLVLPERRIAAGACVCGPAGATALLDVVQGTRGPRRIRFGVEVPLAEPVCARAGRACDPGEISGGLGVKTNGIGLDTSIHWHSVLGFSFRLSVMLGGGEADPRADSLSPSRDGQ